LRREAGLIYVRLIKMRLLILLGILSGCAPFVEYEHLDATPLNNDEMAYDLLCAGGQADVSIKLSGSICKNTRGGEFFKFNARYVFE